MRCKGWILGPRIGQAAFGAVLVLVLGALLVPVRADEVAVRTDEEALRADEEALLCEEVSHKVLLTIQNIRSSDGLLTVELYDDNPDTFIKKAGRIHRLRVEALEGEAEVCLLAPGPGTYAIVLYHDENGNKKFDKNFLGIPKEGFGVSNNPGFSFSAPKHSEAAFSLDGEPVALSISVYYLWAS